jgi:hypothetical protein
VYLGSVREHRPTQLRRRLVLAISVLLAVVEVHRRGRQRVLERLHRPVVALAVVVDDHGHHGSGHAGVGRQQVQHAQLQPGEASGARKVGVEATRKGTKQRVHHVGVAGCAPPWPMVVLLLALSRTLAVLVVLVVVVVVVVVVATAAASPTRALLLLLLAARRRVHLQHLDGRSADAVLPQLLQLQALAVLAAHVHEQRVVGYAKDARRLARRHLLVPHVLQGLGELGVGPRPWRSSARCAVLALGSLHCKGMDEIKRKPLIS